MDIQIERRSNRIVATCSGRLDTAQAPELEKALTPLLADEGLTVCLDLSGMDYVSSAGIRALLYLYKLGLKVGPGQSPTVPPRFRLSNVSPRVWKIIALAGLTEALLQSKPSTTASRPVPGRTCADLLPKVRECFPAPVSDPVRDAQLIQVINQGLRLVDGLKTERPYLGRRGQIDYQSARHATIPEAMGDLSTVIPALAGYLEGLVIGGHPQTQEAVVPPTTIPALTGQLLCSLFNPDLSGDAYSHLLSQAEVEASAICARLVGYDPDQAAGLFTFDGNGAILYGAKIGLEKAVPGAFRQGVSPGLRIVASAAAHQAKWTVPGWLGLGTEALVEVPTDSDNSMDLDALDKTVRSLLDDGRRLACIVATMGTADAFGVDNLEYVVRLRDHMISKYSLDYRPHVHADAAIGWAWSVFNDYDFDGNPMAFPPRTLRCLWDTSANLRALSLADSIGLDFHQTGYAPFTSSLFLCRRRHDLELISGDPGAVNGLYQAGRHRPGAFTLEASRSGGAVLGALANLKLLGKEGFRALLGHLVSVAEHFRDHLERQPYACLVNGYNYGPITLFRMYPEGVDAAAACQAECTDPRQEALRLSGNEFNRKIFQVLQRQMEEGHGFALALTPQPLRAIPGAFILALKSFPSSPFCEPSTMDQLVECLEAARQEVGKD